MRTRELTAGALLLLLAMMQMNAGPVLRPGCYGPEVTGSCAAPEYEPRKTTERLKAVVVPEPTSQVVKNDERLNTAYYDTMSILRSPNQCSAFFGGSESSVYVFSSFMAKVTRSQLPVGVGVKMSGDYTNVLNATTQLRFRLFEKASINTAGPFYQRRVSMMSTPTVFGIGSFPPSSRQARVLMLLHELGHLMRGSDGKWLLPDDGKDMFDSLENTRKVELICGEQIRDLGKQDTDIELSRQNSSEPTVSPAAATSSH
jgi:hypothetical protein